MVVGDPRLQGLDALEADLATEAIARIGAAPAWLRRDRALLARKFLARRLRDAMEAGGQDALLEKWARDSKIMDIFEGTQQIQQLVVARRLLGLSSSELK